MLHDVFLVIFIMIYFLFLQGKKPGETCSMLGETETDINSTRTRIRRKLNMRSPDNLMKILQARVEAVKDKSAKKDGSFASCMKLFF